MFTVISSVLVGAAVLTVAYVVLSRMGKLFFHGPRRAEIAAVAMLMTFAFGYGVGHGSASRGADTSVTAQQPHAPMSTVSKVHDVSGECDPKLAPQPGGDGNVDVLLKALVAAPVAWDEPLDRSSSYSVIGWGLSRSKTDVALAACLVIDGRIATGIKSLYGGARPDVAAARKSDADTYSGFVLVIPPNYLSAGPHTLQVAVKSPDQTMLFAAGSHTLIVH